MGDVEEYHSLGNIIPLENALLEIGEDVNISELFHTDNVEYIYEEEQAKDKVNYCGTGGLMEEELNELLNENVQPEEQGKELIEDGRKGDENNQAAVQIEEVRENHIEEVILLTNFEGNNSKDHDDEGGKRKRLRKKNSDPSSWEKNVTKFKRMTGQPYIGYQRKKTDDNVQITRTDFERDGRKMGPKCDSKMCKDSGKRFCNHFSDADRQRLFDEFWKLTWQEKEMYVKCNTSITEPKKRSGQTLSRRSATVQYNLKLNGVPKRVCKNMFLHTLGLNEWMVLHWIKKNISQAQEEQEVDDTEHVAEASTTETETLKESKISKKRADLIEWFQSVPKLPSHYARRDTKKLYLEPTWTSKQEMYRTYKEKMIEGNKSWGSEALFDKIFKELNLSLFSPRKDQCDTCCSHKLGNISDEVYEKHIREKERAREEKGKDKKLAEEDKIYCLTCDLQAVKLTPFTKANAMYYKTKLASHNFTVYNLGNHDCTNYWFNETECDLSANTFASCLISFLEEKCLEPKRPIVIYSDGCTYQNRNQVMSNALLHFSVNHNVQVEQKFLVKGHTQMECDSVHACIERQLKGKDIYVPYELVNYTKVARMEPSPYDVKYLCHDFILDYSKISYYDSIRPGRVVGDPVVTDIHCLLYKTDGIIYYKLQFDDAYEKLPRRHATFDKEFKPPQLYQDRLPILESKWKHLQELKAVIPSDFHSFYDNIPYGRTPKNKLQKQDKDGDKSMVDSKPTKGGKKLLTKGKRSVQDSTAISNKRKKTNTEDSKAIKKTKNRIRHK